MAPPRTLSNVEMDEDPLWPAMQPPPDETPEQMTKRLKLETEAKKVSDQIDEAINSESAILKRQKIVRLLLLGQCGSGKSTILKEFQLLHLPNAFTNERLSWRTVIQLNIIKNIRRILEVALSNPPPVSPAESPSYSDSGGSASTSSAAYLSMSMGSSASTSSIGSRDPHGFNSLRVRLLPLLRTEEILAHKLASSSMFDFQGQAPGVQKGTTRAPWTERQASNTETFSQSRNTWKGKNKEVPDPQVTEDEVTCIIYCCREDMLGLWRNPYVQDLLSHKKLTLSKSSLFFMNDLDRIAASDYVPTDDDILAARLQTDGVTEHKFVISTMRDECVDWRIYHVGRVHSQRMAWAPFFDNVQAIIFLAPISAFDEVLPDDLSVNCLEDSLTSWKELCKNTVLSKVPLILFLSKCDLLKQKLDSGVRLNTYISSYGDRPNDYESISRFLRSKFDAIQRQYSTKPERETHIHLTNLTGGRLTTSIITSVRDVILRNNLRTSELMR